jgi:hypothetical protein
MFTRVPVSVRVTVSAFVSVLVLVSVSGCGHRGQATHLTEPKPGEPERLAWITWPDVDAMIYCTKRVDGHGLPVGVPGPCLRFAAGEEPRKVVSWMSLSRTDPSPPTRAPDPRCRVELEPAKLVPTPTPARAWWVTPTERTLLDEWMPEPRTQGDRFMIEPTFSPEVKWMGVLHVVVQLGIDEVIISVDSAAIRPVPACR